MNIIVPMAGMGKRMRPHTLTVPKPLIPLAGKPIVQRLLEDIVKVCQEPVEEIAFVIGRFGAETEKQLLQIAQDLGSTGTIQYQDEALGTAHAILCAAEALKGNVIVAFADTLFKADFKLDSQQDGIIWVHKVADPSAFGVVKLDHQNLITDFIEKPEEFISDLAIIGIYYFRDGYNLRQELQYLLDHNIKDKGEFQLTNALENMKNKGLKFAPGAVTEWLDCGNKDSTVNTHTRYLDIIKEEELISKSAKLSNTVIIPPVYIGEKVEINNCVIGPNVSLGQNCVVSESVISNSIIQSNTIIINSNLTNSMLGNFVEFSNVKSDVSIGDYTKIAF